MTEEVFKDIERYDGRYVVSNYGRVYSRLAEKMLKPIHRRDGYLQLILTTTDGELKHELIHRLVAEAFCEKKDGCNVVNHIDSNKRNNNASNLEWTTQKENMIHAWIHRPAEHENSQSIKVYKDGVFIGTLEGTGWSFEEVMVSDEDTA